MVTSLNGKVALVTGGGSGIGRACGLALGRVGVSLVLVGRNAAKLEAVAEEVRGGTESRVMTMALDVTDGDCGATLASAVMKEMGGLDMLVHSAGMFRQTSVEETTAQVFRSHMETNVVAPFALTREFLPMLRRRMGQVVFMNSSVVGARRSELAAYSASKHALAGLADSLRAEVNQFGIRVLSIFVGRTATPLQERITQKEGRDYRPSSLLQPEDIASMVLAALILPSTAEVTDLHIRPMQKSE